jgi:hypothetical protein
MKILLHYRIQLLLFFFAINTSQSFGQTTIWSDNFNNGCASNCLATTWNGWTIINNDGGTTGGSPNNWFISCAEEGVAPPGCGSSCVGDASLHIGADPGSGGDMGASYNETGATNATYKTAVSPTINTSAYAGTITLTFDFIAYGSAGCSDDRLQLRLSTDNGATWPAGLQYCLTSVCCGACNGYSQGQWTTYTLVLPASFSSNPNVRIGFNWRNNGNGSGTDPSAAIDDIRLTTPTPMAVDLLSFKSETKANNSGTELTWKVDDEKDFSRYDLERSPDGNTFSKIYTKQGNCTGNDPCTYNYTDVAHQSMVYYRLKMIDKDEHFRYSTVISIDPAISTSSNYTLLSCFGGDNEIEVKLNSKKKTTANFVVYNIAGNEVVSRKDVAIKEGNNTVTINASKLPKGVYLLKIYMKDDKVLSAKVIM